ncbi:mediator of RNA polymerase II transcription subunit 4-like [Uloborus diversus]|uniref:mediator of RNA polymerase II transcription subunit 4-like n=1 Tax=Uloborus diversus TaxID=327109 RepID=UPI002409D064|nr:mediator of RNA polymerase II transcription subunit 4-like [Uloborus diversus]
MATPGTKDTLLSIIDDIELIAKELFENLIAPKGQKLTSTELSQLAELLVLKDHELKATLEVATEQAELQKKIDALQLEVEKQDQDIHHLQKYLKEAENLLATAVFQAKQKLQWISKGNEKSVLVDDLIKYAHRISCSYAVAAPHNWQPGDPRRPYPTDIEMRLGFLGRMSDLPSGASMLQQGNLDMSVARGPHSEQNPSSQAGTFTWPSSDFKSNMATASSHGVGMDTKSHNKENEDVEVMSTDSSSSSSSDSQ